MDRPVLNNIELPATDMATAQTFYTQVFGWNWTNHGPTYSAADASGIEVALTTAAQPAARAAIDDESSIGPLVLFQVEDLDASVAAVVAAGGEVVTQPFGFPGGSRFHFRDPSNNVLGNYRLDADRPPTLRPPSIAHVERVTSIPHVVAVHRAPGHDFSKQTTDSITLLAGLGVEGDAHMGARVKHRSRVAKDPTQPNLRQVHLIASELLDEVNAKGYDVAPGDLGENITTAGLDLISMPVGTSIRVGDVVLALTGLRNPCVQIDAFADGLQGEMLDHDANGKLVRKTGVMAVVLRGGEVTSGDEVLVAAPAGEPVPMEKI